MRPTLLSIGPFHFHSYVVCLSIAFLVGVLLAVRENYRRPDPYPITPMIGLSILAFALVGSRAYFIIQYDDWRHLYRAIMPWSGGLVYFGGLLGGLFGAWVYLRAKKIPFLPVADIAVPYLALAQAIGRLGCFLNGCCYGSPTQFPWGVHYPQGSLYAYASHLRKELIPPGSTQSLACHPVQLYSSLGLVLLFLLLRWQYRRSHPAGAVALLYLGFYGLLRFTTEFFRGDSAQSVLGMTVSQALALGFALLALGSHFLLWKYSGTAGEAASRDLRT